MRRKNVVEEREPRQEPTGLTNLYQLNNNFNILIKEAYELLKQTESKYFRRLTYY